MRWVAAVGSQVRWPVLAVLGVCLLWGASLRDGARTASEAFGSPLPSAPEAFLAYAGDPYLILYFLLPVYLFTVTSGIVHDGDYPTIIRAGTTARWLLLGVRSGVAPTAALVAAWAAAGTVSTLGLTAGASSITAPVTAAGAASSQVLEALRPTGAPTLLLALVQVLLLGAALLVLRAALSLVYRLTRSLGALAVAGALVWLASVLSFVLAYTVGAGPIDVLTLHHAVQLVPWWAAPVLPAAVLAACLAVAVVVDRGTGPLRAAGEVLRRPTVVYALVCAAAVAAVAPVVAASATSPWDLFLATAWGSSPDGVSPTTFSLFTVVFVGFAYIVSLRLDEELGDRLPYLMIRHRSMTGWLLRLFASFAVQAAGLLAGLFVLTAVLGHLLVPSGAATGGADAPVRMSGAALYQFGVNGLLQLLAYAAVLFVLVWWRRSSTWALGALAAFVILSLPGANLGGWLPVARNSVGLLSAGTAPLGISAQLLAVDAALVALAAWLVTTSGRTTEERS